MPAAEIIDGNLYLQSTVARDFVEKPRDVCNRLILSDFENNSSKREVVHARGLGQHHRVAVQANAARQRVDAEATLHAELRRGGNCTERAVTIEHIERLTVHSGEY